MNFYIVAGILLIIIVSFATWGYLQEYRDWRSRILENREAEALVKRLVYGEGMLDEPASFLDQGTEVD